MLGNIKTAKDIKAQSFLVGGWLLWIFKISQSILYSSINQQEEEEEIHDTQVPKYDFNK